MLNQKSRIIQLNLILQYCFYKGGIFTTGERICINQERAYLLGFSSPQPPIIKIFEYNELLTYKINSTIQKIQMVNWMPENSIEIDWNINK